MNEDPNADLEHTNQTSCGPGGNCMTCGVKWPCPTEARRRVEPVTEVAP